MNVHFAYQYRYLINQPPSTNITKSQFLLTSARSRVTTLATVIGRDLSRPYPGCKVTAGRRRPPHIPFGRIRNEVEQITSWWRNLYRSRGVVASCARATLPAQPDRRGRSRHFLTAVKLIVSSTRECFY